MSEPITIAEIARALDILLTENERLLKENEALKRAPANNQKKLSKKDARHIRELKRAGYTQRDIADAYDINPATVSRIVRGAYHR